MVCIPIICIPTVCIPVTNLGDEYGWRILVMAFGWRNWVTNLGDKFGWQIWVMYLGDEFCWRIWVANFGWQIWVTNSNLDFSEFFFLTFNLLTIASFRIGVPSILFLKIFNVFRLWDAKFVTIYCQKLLFLASYFHSFLLYAECPSPNYK